MTPGIRLVITAVVLCHLLVATPLVTSQLLPGDTFPCQAVALQTAEPTGNASALQPTQVGELVTVRAHTQEKEGDTWRLSGDAQINYRNYQLNADEITYDQSTGEATATGHVVVQGGPHDERLNASSADYNVNTETGSFQDFIGTTGIVMRRGHMGLTSPTPFAFRGREVEKTGPDRYVVHGGSVTSCSPESPAWSFNAETVVVDVGASARLYNSTFRLHGIPVFYLPFVARPVQVLGRQSGFLMPTAGRSSRKGYTVGESFYWAISRTMDATVGGEYFSLRGWSQQGQFRARPTQNSYFEGHYFGVIDRGLPTASVPPGYPSKGPNRIDQGGREIRATYESALPFNTRAVADIDYLSSFLFRLAFAENFTQAVNSEVRSIAFLSHAHDGVELNLMASRYQNFESPVRGDLVTILQMPSLESSMVEHSLFGTRLMWSYEGALEGVSRREPGFVTSALVGRFDGSPTLALPLLVHGWSVRPEVAIRDTYYTEHLQPNGSLGVPIPTSINRQALEISLELRPPGVSRVFNRTFRDRKWKHSIEPRIVYRYTTGVSNFNEIIRFDARDLLSDTNEVQYGMVQRLFTKRLKAEKCTPEEQRQAAETGVNAASRFGATLVDTFDRPKDCDPAGTVRQVATWELTQKAFLDPRFGGALITGQRNVFTTTDELTGIAFLTEPRTLSPIVSRLRVFPTRRLDLQWNLDYDTKLGHVNDSIAIGEFRLGEIFFGGSHAFIRVPGEVFVVPGGTVPPTTTLALANFPAPDRFNQFRVLTGYGHPNKRGFSIAANAGVDSNFNFLQYGTIQTSYNWQCIGLSVEYRRLALGVVRNENQFRFSLNLANIGTFGTLRRQESLF